MFPLGSRVHLISRSSGLPWCFLPVRGAPRLVHPHGPDTRRPCWRPSPRPPRPAVTELRHPVPRTGCPMTVGHPRHHHPSSAHRCPWRVLTVLPPRLRAVGPACSSQPVIPGGYGVALPSVAWEAEQRRARVLVCCWPRLLVRLARFGFCGEGGWWWWSFSRGGIV